MSSVGMKWNGQTFELGMECESLADFNEKMTAVRAFVETVWPANAETKDPAPEPVAILEDPHVQNYIDAARRSRKPGAVHPIPSEIRDRMGL